MGRGGAVSRTRLATAAICLSLWGAAIAWRLVDLHVVRAEYYRSRASQQHQQEQDISPQRGAIRDRNGNDLAISIEVDSLYAEPEKIDDPFHTAEVLAPILGDSAAVLRARLTDDGPFVWVKRKITASQSARIRAAALPGLNFRQESRRYYPNVQLAAHVLGFVNLDNHGASGLEYQYDDLIGGQPGTVLLLRDARNKTYERLERSPTEGASLTLTLDRIIQHFVEEEIGRTIEETHAIGMSVVVLEPATGAILAMANYPTFNPNEYTRFPETSWSNRAIRSVYEPGSTFKIATAAAVLEEGVGKIDEIVDGKNGGITIHGIRIRDHKPFGLLTMREVLQYSSNVGIIQFGTRLGDTRFARYIERFGFGQKTGIDLMGEEKGIVRPPEAWSGLSSAVISMGQEIAVTPLQILSLAAAVGNGGTMHRPFVVSQIEHIDGRVERTSPEGNEVMSERTAALLQDALARVVTDGTGQSAGIPGFTAAGKTGTAQKIDPVTGRYSTTKYVASFVGYAPASNPSIAAIVVIDEPRGGYHGGEVAAPVFGRLGAEILRYLDVQPDVPTAPVYTEGGSGARPDRPATEQEPDLWVASEGDWEMVNVSLSAAADPVIVNALAPGGELTVPNYYGMPLREVFGDTARLGLNLLSEGSGVAVDQWPRAGSRVPRETPIEVRFATTPRVAPGNR